MIELSAEFGRAPGKYEENVDQEIYLGNLGKNDIQYVGNHK